MNAKQRAARDRQISERSPDRIEFDRLEAEASAAANTLTIGHIQKGYDDERWLGWGYLGGRTEYMGEQGLKTLAEADRTVLAYANDHGWTYDQLFAWMNSRPGRHFADDPTHPQAHTCLHEITD